MKCLLLFMLFLYSGSFTFAQSAFKGVVTDEESKQPVPYVSIGIINKASGTVSNVNGEFKIDLDANITDNDTLKFSSIGFESRAFLVGELKIKFKDTPLSISLKKAVNQLKQVIVYSNRGHEKILGYETTSKLLGLGFNASGMGAQGGVRIPIKHQNTNIESFSFFIIQNTFEHLAFRVNIYEMEDGKPGKSILNDNVIVKIDDKQSGKITVDLTPYNINVDKDVLISLEWLEARPAANAVLNVAAVLFGSSYFRPASQDKWIKKRTGLGLSVKVNY